MESILLFIYLIASITFILGLKMLSNPKSARKGNTVAALGMGLAIIGTIVLYTNDSGEHLGNHIWILCGLMIGGVIGTMSAKKVQMTAMPQMVSLFNGMGFPLNKGHGIRGVDVPGSTRLFHGATA